MNRMERHRRPRLASATAPLRIGTDICKTGADAGSGAGEKIELDCRWRNHERTEDQTERRSLRLANADADLGWRVHAVNETPGRNAVARAKCCNFIRQGG